MSSISEFMGQIMTEDKELISGCGLSQEFKTMDRLMQMVKDFKEGKVLLEKDYMDLTDPKAQASAANLIVKQEKLSTGEVRSEFKVPLLTKPLKKKVTNKKKESVVVKKEVPRDSDVFIQEPVIPEIDLSEEEEKPKSGVARKKTKTTTAQRTRVTRSTKVNDESTTKNGNKDQSDNMDFEDALSNLEDGTFKETDKTNTDIEQLAQDLEQVLSDKTYVCTKPKTVNQTFVVEPTEPIADISPVKKMVAAYEKLTKVSSNVSHTKTSRLRIPKLSSTREHALGLTPNARHLPTATSTAKKNLELSSFKAMTNTSKYNSPLQSKIATSKLGLKRGISEDQTHKVKKIQKENQELNKLLEYQRSKEEKSKLLLLQKEEKLKKQKEENERKRILAKLRAEELKKEEALVNIKKTPKANKTLLKKVLEKSIDTAAEPLYLVKKAPPLPTVFYMDTDDEENGKDTPAYPVWTKAINLGKTAKLKKRIGQKIINTTFHCVNRHTNLEDVLYSVKKRPLKRSSSIYWHKPPRYTFLTTDMQMN